MSDGLTNRDSAVMDAAMGGSSTIGNGHADAVETDRESELETDEYPPAYVEELEDRVDDLEATVKSLVKKMGRLERQVEGNEGGVGQTQLARYAYNLEPEDREEALSANERRAVVVYEHWNQLCWQGQNGRYLVNTKRRANTKNHPAKFKLDLEKILGESLDPNTVYRTMKKVAELSGSELEHDESNREHYVGGDWEFHERTTPDNTDRSTYRVLIEVPE